MRYGPTIRLFALRNDPFPWNAHSTEPGYGSLLTVPIFHLDVVLLQLRIELDIGRFIVVGLHVSIDNPLPTCM